MNLNEGKVFEIYQSDLIILFYSSIFALEKKPGK